MHEILDSGVYCKTIERNFLIFLNYRLTVVLEIVTKGRQPYVNMHSIYFISPTDEIVDQVIKDFTPPTQRLVSRRKGPAYAAAHLYFTSGVTQALFEKLAASPAAPHIKTFMECYINFIAFESKAWHLGADEKLFGRLFKTRPAGLQDSTGIGDFQIMADQIVGQCVTMNEIPKIRYQKASGISLKLATLVQEGLEAYCSKNETFKPLRDGQLLIVDRTFDLLAPLLHEFTLQAMANDLLTIVDGTKFTYKYSTGASAEASREVTLDESDSMWVALRHLHIADVSKKIIQKFNEFVTENKAAAATSGNGVTSLAELRETMNDLGEFHELKSIYSLHLSIAQECLSIFERKKLMGVARVEQDMATGLDADGEKVENIWGEMAPLLDQTGLSSKDKARLVMIYLLTQPNLSDQDKRSLFDHAKLGKEEMEAVRLLTSFTQNKYGQREPACQSKRGHRKTLLDEDFPYEVSRYVPSLKIALDDAVNGELSEDEFPYLKASSSAAASTAKTSTQTAPVSLRSRMGTGQSASATSSAANAGSVSAFVIGGMTYSEMRSAYELAQRNSRECFIGADRILTPETFLDLLKQLGQ